MTRGQLVRAAVWLAIGSAFAPATVRAAEPANHAEWRDRFIWTNGDDCVVRSDAWSLDVCAKLAAPAGEIGLSVEDDELYVHAGQNVLAVDPESGEVRGQWLDGVPEPKDPAPSPTKKNDGCDCSFERSAPPGGFTSFALLVAGALVARSRRPHRRR